jgi:hypothetical protein
VATPKAKAQKIKEFPCPRRLFGAFRIAIFFDILTDFSTPCDIFGRILGADFVQQFPF